MADQLKQLAAAGQSIWLDNIRRSMFASGELRRLIDAGLRGMTSNPTIFEKAIGSGTDYDDQLRSLAGRSSRRSRLTTSVTRSTNFGRSTMRPAAAMVSSASKCHRCSRTTRPEPSPRRSAFGKRSTGRT